MAGTRRDAQGTAYPITGGAVDLDKVILCEQLSAIPIHASHILWIAND